MNKAFITVTAFFLITTAVFAQKPNWQNMDLKTDSAFGISTDKAYATLLKNRKPVNVLVAVIDGGIDTGHEDLKGVIWINRKDKAGNKKDDDRNGYIDDVHGWNFIGSAQGNINKDNTELARQVKLNQNRFEGKDQAAITAADQPAFAEYQKRKKDLTQKLTEAQQTVRGIGGFKLVLDSITQKIGKSNPAITDFQAYNATSAPQKRVREVIINQLQSEPDFNKFVEEQINGAIKHYRDNIDYMYNINFDPRPLVGDNYNDVSQKYYGNNDITGPDADHGTHVAGIIGAVRNNDIGMNGVADHVQIIGVRAVPDGDERDKDIANAIRYATDNGAKVINMSFGKEYSPYKSLVDDAVKYAMAKDVLLIHAAGNDNKNLELENNFPNKTYADKSGQASAWIEVGASGAKDDETLKAVFSNYGKTTVDVFAPGVAIYSTIPGSKYDKHDGTSMASPVVTGLAALIREYYPKLTAIQVKDVIMKSVVKINHNVNVAQGGSEQSVPFADLCVSGGIINAYQALELAARYNAI